MAETRADVFANCAGLLARMGYHARCDPTYTPIGQRQPVPALVTDCPEMLVGYAVAMVAEDPEAHVPARSDRVPKAKNRARVSALVAWF